MTRLFKTGFGYARRERFFYISLNALGTSGVPVCVWIYDTHERSGFYNKLI